MKRIGCYRDAAPDEPLAGRERLARAAAGGVFIVCVWPVALLREIGVSGLVTWALAAAALWVGGSHLVAAVTGYRGCPEIGAIASLVLRRHVRTACTPWERADRWIRAR
jgi:hypothetical protein